MLPSAKLRGARAAAVLLCASMLTACAIGEALLASFNSDDDPELVASSLPTMIKLSETMLQLSPHDPGSYLRAGMLLTMYTNAFVQTPAEQLDALYFDQQKTGLQRAKKLYLRAHGYLLRAVQLRHPSWPAQAPLGDSQLALVHQANYDYFHWLALSWLAALAVDPLDFNLLTEISTPIQLLFRLLQVNEERDDIHNSLLSLLSALPLPLLEQALAHSPELQTFVKGYYQKVEDQSEHHFQRALQLTGGYNPAGLVTMAKAQIKSQNRPRFTELLGQVLVLPLEQRPDRKLLTSVYQQQAAWLLANIDNFFL